jgi:hypothetical protein
VPPHHVRELRSLISFRWRLNKQLTMSKNRDWWEEQELSDLTTFEVKQDLAIVL